MTAFINATTANGIVLTPDNSGELGLQTSGTTALTVNSSQNVGIGTSSPTSRLHVYGATNSQLTLQNATNTCFVGNISGSMEIQSADIIKFATGGSSERMRIDTSGNLLVGTTSAGGDGLSVQVRASSGGTTQITFNRASGSLTGDAVAFNNGGSRVGTITYNNTSTAYLTSSDYRLKENIAPMTGALDKVQALKPCTYTWKDGGSSGQGFIAHELQEVCPDAVSGEKDAVDADGNPKYQGVDTSFLVATLTAAIQELNAKVDAQAAEIQALKGAA